MEEQIERQKTAINGFAKEIEAAKAEREADEKERDALRTELNNVDSEIEKGTAKKEQELNLAIPERDRLKEDASRWETEYRRLERFVSEEDVNDMLSSSQMECVERFYAGTASEDDIRSLQDAVKQIRDELRDNFEDAHSKEVEVGKKLEEVECVYNNAKNGQKYYGWAHESIMDAKRRLEDRLKGMYGHPVHVNVMADMFSIKDPVWENAIEGVFGKKTALVTEPKYAKDAIEFLHQLKSNNREKFWPVSMIDSERIREVYNERQVENSLYGHVESNTDYIDTCLRYYLGKIRCCTSVSELRSSHYGIMSDCTVFRDCAMESINPKNYKNHVIGYKGKSEYRECEEEYRRLKDEYRLCKDETSHWDNLRTIGYTVLKEDAKQYVRLGKANRELAAVVQKIERIRQDLEELKNNELKSLSERKNALNKKIFVLEAKVRQNDDRIVESSQKLGDIRARKEKYEEEWFALNQAYSSVQERESSINEKLSGMSKRKLAAQFEQELSEIGEKKSAYERQYKRVRSEIASRYPILSVDQFAENNDEYQKEYEKYESHYNEIYMNSYTKWSNTLYKQVICNVIYELHCDIRNCKQTVNEINRLLKGKSFGKSEYKVTMEKTKSGYEKYYDMLDSDLLDSIGAVDYDADSIDSQLSLGAKEFAELYKDQIDSFVKSFLPKDDYMTEDNRRVWEAAYTKFMDYRTYLDFDLKEMATDENGSICWKSAQAANSGGEAQNPKYVVLLSSFALRYNVNDRNPKNSTFRAVIFDEAFSKMDASRAAVVMDYAKQLRLQMFVVQPSKELGTIYPCVNSLHAFITPKGGYTQIQHTNRRVVQGVYEEGMTWQEAYAREEKEAVQVKEESTCTEKKASYEQVTMEIPES